MVLGHTRDFFSGGGWNPRDVTDPALFLTRWITHFCAPTFIFLAGLAAYLYGARGRSLAKTSRFLFTRGLLLILLEFTLVKLGWTFSFNFDQLAAGVIWAIGASMVVLAALVHLPRVDPGPQPAGWHPRRESRISRLGLVFPSPTRFRPPRQWHDCVCHVLLALQCLL